MDGFDSVTEYEYDENGNLTKDFNRNILSIQYNSLNLQSKIAMMDGTSGKQTSFFSTRFAPSLPSKITFTDGRTTKYRYCADGTKLRAEYTTAIPASIKLMDYYDNMIYEDLQSKQLLVDGGYIAMDDYSRSYHFYVQDHLGNNRMVVHENGMVEQVNHYYPYGGLMAESTGWNAQRYKYNGKEFDRMHGLDCYDYGVNIIRKKSQCPVSCLRILVTFKVSARWMDASIGRWHSMDPLCEKYYNVSPYGYCLEYSINQFDLDGKKVWVFATKLPNSPIKNLGGKFSATHTFVVVQKSNGNIYRYEYGPRGNNMIDNISGMSQLTQCDYVDSRKAVDSYINGIKDANIKNIIEKVPNGKSSNQFDDDVVKSAQDFENNTQIKCRVIPTNELAGNCNTSTTSLLTSDSTSNH